MAIVPDKTVDKIQFYEDHNAPWTANAGAIGITSTQVTTLHTKTVAARTAYNAQQSAQDAAKAATLTLNTAASDMASYGASVIQSIKAKAATDGNSVYSLAQIPAPATPTPVGPPGTPFDFTTILNPDGSLKLSWKCTNPTNAVGTIYSVQRKLATESAFTFIGGSGTKSFVDDTVPTAGVPITYQITAQRSTVSGTAAQFIVNFGVAGSGEMTASVIAAPRIAA